MQKLSFYKYQGTGNDFVMVDNRSEDLKVSKALVRQLCDRRFGIGADGLILIENKEGCDFEMVYYNSDGSQSLCGNGSRCAVRFAEFLGIVSGSTRFMTIDGVLTAEINPESIRLKMPDVNKVETAGKDYFIHTGSPHYIQFVDKVKDFDVFENGKSLRDFKKDGTNVNFVEKTGENSIFVRTFERGVEDETLSCGTGVTACALACGYLGFKGPVAVQTLGGQLSVNFEKSNDSQFQNIYLEGPAEFVFEGIFRY